MYFIIIIYIKHSKLDWSLLLSLVRGVQGVISWTIIDWVKTGYHKHLFDYNYQNPPCMRTNIAPPCIFNFIVHCVVCPLAYILTLRFFRSAILHFCSFFTLFFFREDGAWYTRPSLFKTWIVKWLIAYFDKKEFIKLDSRSICRSWSWNCFFRLPSCTILSVVRIHGTVKENVQLMHGQTFVSSRLHFSCLCLCYLSN